YAGISVGGVFKSIDGGGSWSAVNTGLTYASVTALAIDPQTPTTLYAGTPVGVNNGGVFKSTNGGGSWTAVNTGLPNFFVVRALAIDPQTPATLYAVAVQYSYPLGNNLFKSTNGGGSWSAVNTGLTGVV